MFFLIIQEIIGDFGESSGSTAVDETGAKDLTYGGTPVYGAGSLIDDTDTAVNFNSAGKASGSSFPAFTLPISFECWINIPDIFVAQGPIFISHDDVFDYRGFIVAVSNLNSFTFQFGNGGLNGPNSRKTHFTADPIPTNAPTHLVAVARSILDVELYVNGVQVATTLSGNATTIDYSVGTANIGYSELQVYDAGGNHYYPGVIDEVAVYDGVALSSGQILSHYNAGI